METLSTFSKRTNHAITLTSKKRFDFKSQGQFCNKKFHQTECMKLPCGDHNV